MPRRHRLYVDRTLKQRARHSESYYDESLTIPVSPDVKAGLIEIALIEGRSLTWVCNEVFSIFFGLHDDTEILLSKPVKLRRVK